MDTIHNYYNTANKFEKYTIERILNLDVNDFDMWLWDVEYALDNCKAVKMLFSTVDLKDVYRSTSKLSTITDEITENILFHCSLYFPGHDIYIYDSRIIIEWKGSKCLHFSLIGFEDNFAISVLYIQKHSLSGRDILERLELLLKENIRDVKAIYLTDDSEFKWKKYHIGLSGFYILVHGETWYSSLGYKSKTYELEKQLWDQKRQTPLKDIIPCTVSGFDAESSIANICRLIYAKMKNGIECDIRILNVAIYYIEDFYSDRVCIKYI